MSQSIVPQLQILRKFTRNTITDYGSFWLIWDIIFWTYSEFYWLAEPIIIIEILYINFPIFLNFVGISEL